MKTAEDLVRQAKERITEIAAPDVARQLDNVDDAVLIDVREPSEYQEGHLPGAVNIPRGVLEFQVAGHPALACETTAPELARFEREIIIYCRSGGRSALAAESLASMGFTRVASLAGGFLDWSARGLPVTR